MGWLYQYDPVPDVKRHFRQEVFRTSTPGYKYEVVDDAIAPGYGDGERVYFAAVRYSAPEVEPQMYLAVCLFRNTKKDGFGYKDMTEDAGPYNFNCPLRLFKLVPEPTKGPAVEWRAKVREYWAQKATSRKATSKIGPGMFIRLQHELTFLKGAVKEGRFEVVEVPGRSRWKQLGEGRMQLVPTKRQVYRTPSGMLCRFPARYLANVEVITREEFYAPAPAKVVEAA